MSYVCYLGDFLKIKNTKSLCPECGRPVDAEVYDEGGKVYIKKTCSVHGEFINTYWNDVETYDRVRDYEPSITSVENPSVDDISTCPSNCGLCSKHETSTVLGLIDVTNRCNLKCPVCFPCSCLLSSSARCRPPSSCPRTSPCCRSRYAGR